MIIRSRAPLRLGFAGGGTDVSPFSELYGGQVLNATVNMYAYTVIEAAADGRVRFVAADRSESFEGAAAETFDLAGGLDLHKGVYNRIVQQFNNGEPLPVTMTTFSDVPAGSGLGSSSTMVVSMLKAFTEYLGLPLGEYDVADLAFQIERVDVGLNGGKQDQYAATFGGFNFIEFHGNNRVIVNPLRIKNWIISELESSLVLYYTGVSRSSAVIIDQQSANVRARNEESIAAMQELKEQALHMKESLLKGDLRTFANYLDAGWKSKKRTAQEISNNDIDAVYHAAKRAGATAGKISGAGGGGFLILLVEPTQRMDVIRELERHGGRVVSCHFTKYGTEGWRIQ
jgi:D-glycero-alpha-D-manno-heptose-7-phosphate kinase